MLVFSTPFERRRHHLQFCSQCVGTGGGVGSGSGALRAAAGEAAAAGEPAWAQGWWARFGVMDLMYVGA